MNQEAFFQSNGQYEGDFKSMGIYHERYGKSDPPTRTIVGFRNHAVHDISVGASFNWDPAFSGCIEAEASSEDASSEEDSWSESYSSGESDSMGEREELLQEGRHESGRTMGEGGRWGPGPQKRYRPAGGSGDPVGETATQRPVSFYARTDAKAFSVCEGHENDLVPTDPPGEDMRPSLGGNWVR